MQNKSTFNEESASLLDIINNCLSANVALFMSSNVNGPQTALNSLG